MVKHYTASAEEWTRRISEADDLIRLFRIREQFNAWFAAQISLKTASRDVRMLNRTHDALIRRTVDLSVKQAAEHGLGLPPVPFDFVLFGSGGRKEQTLWSDQDNGIIYDGGGQDRQVHDYFRTLSKCIAENLRRTGYPPCEGGVICSDPGWCLSISQWEKKIKSWFAAADWGSVRYLLILADMRCLCGSGRLTAKLKNTMDRQIKEHPAIMERMRQNSLRHKVLLGAFGQFLKEPYGQNAGGLDIKYGAYIPMVNGVRLLAVCSGIDDTSTLARLVRLCGKSPLPKKVLKRWYQAFVMFLYLRMKTAHRAEDGLLTTNGVIMLNELPKEQTAALKTCLRAGKELQRHIAKMTASQVESP